MKYRRARELLHETFNGVKQLNFYLAPIYRVGKFKKYFNLYWSIYTVRSKNSETEFYL